MWTTLFSCVICEIAGMLILPTLRTDCAPLYDHIYLQKTVSEKRLLIELVVIRDTIKCGQGSNLEWVSTKEHLGDALTKADYKYKFVDTIAKSLLPYRFSRYLRSHYDLPILAICNNYKISRKKKRRMFRKIILRHKVL